MSTNTFSYGVEPGGLRKRGEIKILVCYIFSVADMPFSIDQLAEVLIETGAANYFEAGQAVSELYAIGNIEAVTDQNGIDRYLLSENGRVYLDKLAGELPLSLRERTGAAAKKVLATVRAKKENVAKVEKCDGGYMLTCSVMDREKELLTIRILVSGDSEAARMKDRFINNPTVFYKTVVSLMTGDISLCQNP